jgi:hypothetical protein
MMASLPRQTRVDPSRVRSSAKDAAGRPPAPSVILLLNRPAPATGRGAKRNRIPAGAVTRGPEPEG